jgi:hypothetical protein
MRVPWLVVHRVVDVDALMVEELSQRHHCGVLE